MNWISELLSEEFIKNSWRKHPAIIKMKKEHLQQFPTLAQIDFLTFLLLQISDESRKMIRVVRSEDPIGVSRHFAKAPTWEQFTIGITNKLTVVDDLNVTHPVLRGFTEQALGLPNCSANNLSAYRADAGCRGLPLHFDFGPVLAFHVLGERVWIYGTGKEGEYAKVNLTPGDILHLPDGENYQHKLLPPRSGTSLHFTQGYEVDTTYSLIAKYEQVKSGLARTPLIEINPNYKIQVYNSL